MDLRGLLYVSREHAPITTPQDRLSSEAAELLTGLVEHPDMANALQDRLAKLPRPELSIIFDRVMDFARGIQEWGVPAILDACIVLARIEASFGDRLVAFLSERPASQVTPAIVAKLSPEAWSKKLFTAWSSADVKQSVKGAITKARQ